MPRLRKAILRAGHYKAFRDEEALYRKELADARGAGRPSRIGDWYAFTLAFKAVFLEGLDVAFIVLTFGTSQGSIPLARVPENTMKFAVGLMLAAFGIFWSVEGTGIAWPGADVAFLYNLAFLTLIAFGMVAVLRRLHGRREERPATTSANIAGIGE